MSNKEKKRLQKEQEQASKKKKKEIEARQKMLKAAQKKRAAAGGRGRAAVSSERKGLLARLVSVKGLVLTGVAGYLYIAQRELLFSLCGMLLKYPVLLATWLGRTLVNVLLKPILMRFSSSGTSASDVLPGGAY